MAPSRWLATRALPALVETLQAVKQRPSPTAGEEGGEPGICSSKLIGYAHSGKRAEHRHLEHGRRSLSRPLILHVEGQTTKGNHEHPLDLEEESRRDGHADA